jgi:hypothetical protein
MKKQDNFFYAALFVWVVGTILAITVWLWYETAQGVVVQPPLFPQYSIEELDRAHRYHGIYHSYQDADGQWVFNRDGKRCRLFAYRKGE